MKTLYLFIYLFRLLPPFKPGKPVSALIKMENIFRWKPSLEIFNLLCCWVVSNWRGVYSGNLSSATTTHLTVAEMIPLKGMGLLLGVKVGTTELCLLGVIMAHTPVVMAGLLIAFMDVIAVNTLLNYTAITLLMSVHWFMDQGSVYTHSWAQMKSAASSYLCAEEICWTARTIADWEQKVIDWFTKHGMVQKIDWKIALCCWGSVIPLINSRGKRSAGWLWLVLGGDWTSCGITTNVKMIAPSTLFWNLVILQQLKIKLLIMSIDFSGHRKYKLKLH